MDAIRLMEQRVKDHIERVIFFYSKMLELNLIPPQDARYDEVLEHDKDKLLTLNLEKQSYRFLPSPTPEQMDAINRVVRNHVKSNPHHFEYWGRPEQDHRSTHIYCETMPDKYLYEMIADWMATAEERGTDPERFYLENQGERFIFGGHQEFIILHRLGMLRDYIDPKLKRTYSTNYIDPAYVK